MLKQLKKWLIPVIFSLLVHLIILLNSPVLKALRIHPESPVKPPPPVITFQLSKPDRDKEMTFADNVNFNEIKAQDAHLLSDRDSEARSPQLKEKKGDNPSGNQPSPVNNLTDKLRQAFQKKQPGFSREALAGITSQPVSGQTGEEQQSRTEGENSKSEGASALMKKDFSASEVGALTLSTYQWDWAPYIHQFKNKLYRVWVPPTAYSHLGLIHGYTVVLFTIERNGTISGFQVLDHQGHPSLEQSSVEAIKAIFPFLPLPENFPDNKLVIKAKLYYPDLRQRSIQ